MKRVILSIFFAVFCSSFLYAQDKKESLATLNHSSGYVIERALKAFYCIPDHTRVSEAARPYMTADLYESLAAAWDVPDWLDGEIGNDEFLFYFITGNDVSDRQQIESVTLVSARQGRYVVDVKYREFWGSTAASSLSSISLVLVSEKGNLLLDDIGGETKQQCKKYVQEEVSDYLSGRTNRYMKENQRDGWYTDSYIAEVNKSFKEYLSKYSVYIDRLRR